jgi:hypothetical protein
MAGTVPLPGAVRKSFLLGEAAWRIADRMAPFAAGRHAPRWEARRSEDW